MCSEAKRKKERERGGQNVRDKRMKYRTGIKRFAISAKSGHAGGVYGWYATAISRSCAEKRSATQSGRIRSCRLTASFIAERACWRWISRWRQTMLHGCNIYVVCSTVLSASLERFQLDDRLYEVRTFIVINQFITSIQIQQITP